MKASFPKLFTIFFYIHGAKIVCMIITFITICPIIVMAEMSAKSSKVIKDSKGEHHRDYFPNGSLKSENLILKNGDQDFVSYRYDDGTINFHKLSKNNGETWTTTYAANGDFIWKTHFKPHQFEKIYAEDGTIKYGKIFTSIWGNNYIYKSYYPNGQLMSEKKWNKGQLVNKASIFYSNRKLKDELFYKNGEIDKIKGYDVDGKLVFQKSMAEIKKEKEEYVKNKRTGTLNSYFPIGIRGVYSYVNGELVHDVSFHDNGNPSLEHSYKNGQKNGVQKIYNDFGRLNSEFFYENGKFLYSYGYDDNGNLSTEFSDREEGKRKISTYYKTGKIKQELFYEKGKLIRRINYQSDGKIKELCDINDGPVYIYDI